MSADSPPGFSDAVLKRVLLAASGLFFLWLLFPVPFGLTFTAGDLLAQNLPFRKLYADALHHGDSFLWSPNLYGGFYLFGEGQTGMLHPLHLLLYYFLPLTAAFGMEIVCVYAFLFAGIWLFLRHWKLSTVAALAGAFLSTFGGANLILMEHINGVAVMAHLPWCLLAIQRIFEAQRWPQALRWCAFLAALTGSEALLGHPQSVYFCALAEAVWIICLLLNTPRWRPVLLAGAGLALGLLDGAVQILPTLATVRDSARSAPSLEFLGEMSLHPFELAQWINPLFWNRGRYDQFRGAYNYLIFFGGTAALLLFLWLFTRPAQSAERAPMRRFLISLAGIAMFLALGKYNLLYPLYARLPILGLFRGPVRHTVLADFAVAIGAAFALDRMSEFHLHPLFRRGVYLLMLASLATVVLAFTRIPGLPISSPLMAAAGAILVLLAAAAFLLADRIPPFAPAILVLALVAEVFAFQIPLLWSHNAIADPWPPDALPVDAPGPVQTRFGDQLLLRDYRLVNGYSGLEPLSPIHPSLPVYAQIMGARAILLDTWRMMPDPLPPVRLRNRAVLLRNRDALLRDSEALDRAALMEHRSSVPTLDRDLQQVVHFDFAAAALVEEAVSLDGSASGSIHLEEERPGIIRLTANTTGAMLATTGERYHEAWKVRIDGQPTHTMRVDGSLLGFIVPTGQHRIDCAFDPEDFRTGTRLSLAGLAATLLLLSCTRAFRRVSPYFRKRA